MAAQVSHAQPSGEGQEHLPAPGAIESQDHRVCFTLFAPDRQRVHLVGDFNNWDKSADPLEEVNPGLWSVEKQLAPGRYAYGYIVDDDIEIPDPYARQIEPTDGHTFRSILEVGAEPFAWQHDGFERPKYEDLIIYEMQVGDFSPDGTFRGAAERLDHLKLLGINALQLMPVHQDAAGGHWGYQPVFFFAPDHAFGSPRDLRELIDQAHARDIAVILDIVLAHSDGEHPFLKLSESLKESPWYSQEASDENLFGFPSFSYDKPAGRDFVRDVQAFWLREYHIDGLRYDYLDLVQTQSQEGAGLLVGQAREVRADAYLIGELLPEDPEHINASGLDGNWHVRFSRTVKALTVEKAVDEFDWEAFDDLLLVLDAEDQGYQRPEMMVNFAESHDEQRVIYEALQADFGDEIARHKAALIATLLLTAPGVPMLYHGQEWGEAAEKSQERNAIRWETLDGDGGRGLLDHFRKVCHLRRQHPALRSPNYELMQADNGAKTAVFQRWTEEGERIVVALNASGEKRQIEIDFPEAGQWHDAIADQAIDVEDRYGIELRPYAAAVYIHQ